MNGLRGISLVLAGFVVAFCLIDVSPFLGQRMAHLAFTGSGVVNTRDCVVKLDGAVPSGTSLLPLPVLRTRVEMLTAICEREQLHSVAEIGVQRAHFAQQILSRCPKVTSYMGVDLWATQKSYDDGANVDNSMQSHIFEEAVERLKPFGNRVRLLREDSVLAAAQVRNGSLDFVYLDARHDYRSVQEDILAWAPKVRSGGILAGHDYIDASELDGSWTKYKDGSISHPTKAVRSAVSEFADLTRRQHLVTYGDLSENLPFPSWFLRM